MTPQKPTQEDYNNWHNDPNNWHLGMFYYNKADKRMFVPKKLKWAGFTINFGNPLAILITVAFLFFMYTLTQLK
ncbi:DUF5808 domain-containing protein [Flavobacterium sp. N1736]|uniref:DUF5808 domain-containing protein n=1 Tax=Flavobacterium sp. N1736 TaxID=2986823 RepID=UPI002224B395|nr:DUF5808 domain-containing protein [Flavobacterium sp. N1736]